ncbi:MAG: hypothetical protein ACLUD0_19925 [Eubacterium ramulus]
MSNTSAATALALGGFCTLVFTFIYYMCRRVLAFKRGILSSIGQGYLHNDPGMLCDPDIRVDESQRPSAVDCLGTGGEFVADCCC